MPTDNFEKIIEQKITTAIQWLRSNIQLAGTILAVIVALSLIIYFAISRRQIGLERALEKFSSAQGLYSQGMKDQSITLLNEIISQYPSSPAAFHSRLLLSEIRISDGKYAEAYQNARYVYEKGTPQTLRPFGLYMALMARIEDKATMGSSSLARSEAMLFIEKYPDHFLTPRVYQKLGELYESDGMLEEARQTYSRLANLYPASVWAQKSSERLQRLSQKMEKK